MKTDLPDVHFGSADDKPVDWREATPDSTPDDDVELEQTPQDVIDMLGFDPKAEAVQLIAEDEVQKSNPNRYATGRFGQNTAHWHKLMRIDRHE